MNKIAIFFLAIWFPFAAKAQINLLGGVNGNSKLDQALFEKNYQKVFELQKDIINSSTDAQKIIQAAAYMFKIDSFELSAKAYNKALSICPKCEQSLLFPLGKSLFYANRLSESKTVLSRLKSVNKIWQSDLALEITQIKSNINFIQNQPPLDTTIHVTNLYGNINTATDEYFPTLSPDDSNLIFTRNVNGIDNDFYESKLDTCDYWQKAENMGEPPNSSNQELAQMLSADGHYLFYAAGDNRSDDGWSQGGADLFLAYKQCKNCPWKGAIPFGGTINTIDYEGAPSLSADNHTLYYISNRPDGYGKKDIWLTHYENGMWQTPINLGNIINTPFNETSVYIAPDNKTIYFSSDGHAGYGKQDLFYSVKIGPNDTDWSEPQNLGAPINSIYDEISPFNNAQESTLYFSSNRPDGYGNFDLYKTNLPDSLKPQMVNYLTGFILEKATKNPIKNAFINILNKNDSSILASYKSNKGDASYVAILPLNTPILIDVYQIGYEHYTKEFSFSKQVTYPFDSLNIFLEEPNNLQTTQEYAPAMMNDTIVFNYNKRDTVLNDSMKTILSEKYAQRIIDGTVFFNINSYTDNTGTDAMNTYISGVRGNTIANYLQNLGFQKEQISVNSFGNTQYINNNSTTEQQRINRRVEIICTFTKN